MRLIIALLAIGTLSSCSIFAQREVDEDNPEATKPAFVYDERGILVEAEEGGAIADNPNQIVLSDYTQDEQKRDREFYARQQQEIAAKRMEVVEVEIPEASSVNVVQYARSTSNAVGDRLYSRRGRRGSCSRYPSPYDAQRAFLEAGGPENDDLGLDADGDGFACRFEPDIYRKLR